MHIFLVEDEHWALAELVELLRVYEPDHTVSAFSNGEEAWLAAQKVRPGLVLTDITMPVMDGLELAEKLYQLDPSIKKIIVSVHDQFEYARLGMKFGVIDFMVKPWKKDALYKAVDHALSQINEEARTSEEWLRGSLARMLQTPEAPNHPRLRSFQDDSYQLILLHVDGEGCSRLCEPAFNLDGAVYRIDLDGRQRAILFRAPDPAGEQAFRRATAQWFDDLRKLPLTVHVGLAKKPAGFPLYETFRLLKERLESEQRFSLSSLVSAEAHEPDADLGDVWERVRMLETYYWNGELVKGEAALLKLLDDLKSRRLKKRQLDLFLSDMLFSIKFKLQLKNGGVDVQDLPEHYRLLHNIYTYEELFQRLKYKFMNLYTLEMVGPERIEGNPKELIPKLLHRIHREYRTSISLQRFAAEQHVSLGYLSRMFKAHTGRTFSDYVTDYRIRKARELLSEGVDRLQEVSRLVGYDDPKYFSLQFKKLVGESPMHYAKRMANRQPPHS